MKKQTSWLLAAYVKLVVCLYYTVEEKMICLTAIVSISCERNAWENQIKALQTVINLSWK